MAGLSINYNWYNKNVNNEDSVEWKYAKGVATYLQDYERPFRHTKATVKACGIFEQLAEQNPDDARFQFRLGICQFRMMEVEKAFQAFYKASELSPSEDWIVYHMSRAFLSNGEQPKEKLNEILTKLHDMQFVTENEQLLKRIQENGYWLALKDCTSFKWLFDGFRPLAYSEKRIYQFEIMPSTDSCEGIRQCYSQYYFFHLESPDSIDDKKYVADTLTYTQFTERDEIIRLINPDTTFVLVDFTETILGDYSIIEYFCEKDLSDEVLASLRSMHSGNRVYFEKIRYRKRTESESPILMSSPKAVVYLIGKEEAIYKPYILENGPNFKSRN